MAAFKDSTGREWPFRRITVGDLDELAAAGLDVESVSEDLDRLAELVVKPRRFAAVLWWFVGERVAEAGVDLAAFHAALDGEALAAAVVAVRDSIVEFFPFPAAVKARMIAEMNGQKPSPSPGGSGAAPTNSPASPGSTPAPTPSAT